MDIDTELTINETGEIVKGIDYTFKDLWDNRIRTTLVNMEEGIIQGSWNSGGRVVLMGDAVAKVGFRTHITDYKSNANILA